MKVAEREKKSAQGLKNDPPKILFAEEPTVLVTLDGEPQLRDVEGAPVKLVVNTALFMVLDTRNNRYYLSGGKKWWYEAPDAKGPWRSIGGPPADIADFAAKAVEAQKKDDKDAPAEDGTEAASPPRIVVATEPTELVVSEGKPSFKPVAGTGADLLSMDNTESDVLLDVPSQNYYMLLSGRWFRSKSLGGEGPGRYVSPDALPTTFAKIPPDVGRRRRARERAGHGRGRGRGPRRADPADDGRQARRGEARRAVRRRTEVRRDRGHENGVRAQHADLRPEDPRPLLRVRERRVVRRGLADGPVASRGFGSHGRPGRRSRRACPSTTSSTSSIYDSTPDVVYVGYTPGYVGCYPWDGTVVWGTGWYYRPWIGPAFWWPRPYTWGFHAHYTPWIGWGFGVSWSYPFFNVSHGWGGWFRPVGWGRPRHWDGGWGGGGHRSRLVRTGRLSAADRHREQLLGESSRRRPPARLESPAGRRPGAACIARYREASRARRASGHRLPPACEGRPAARSPEQHLHQAARSRRATFRRPPPRDMSRPAVSRPNNVYADRNGDVYRKTKEGWQQRDKDAWRNSGGSERPVPKAAGRPPDPGATRPMPVPNRGTIDRQPAAAPRAMTRSAPRPELERDFSARQRGEARAQSWSHAAPQAPQARQAPASPPAPAARSAPPARSEPKKR